MDTQNPPTASVRVDRRSGKVFLTALSGEGRKGEVTIDVLPSQMPEIVAAFVDVDHPGADRPAMPPEELEEIKGKIMNMTKAQERFYPYEIATELDLDYDDVMEAMNSLEREGKIRVLDDE
ncbi:MAG: hypothetical protein OXU86_02870 [Thaumarchaeota archaeon]|nr:hypothetical protein [Nitrososphaerota archaeon]